MACVRVFLQNLPQQVHTFVCDEPRHAGDNVIIKLFASRAETLVEARLTISVVRLLKVHTSTIRGAVRRSVMRYLSVDSVKIAWLIFFCIGDTSCRKQYVVNRTLECREERTPSFHAIRDINSFLHICTLLLRYVHHSIFTEYKYSKIIYIL